MTSLSSSGVSLAGTQSPVWVRAGIALQPADEFADVTDARDITQELGDQIPFVFAGLLHPFVVGVPFGLVGVAG